MSPLGSQGSPDSWPLSQPRSRTFSNWKCRKHSPARTSSTLPRVFSMPKQRNQSNICNLLTARDAPLIYWPQGKYIFGGVSKYKKWWRPQWTIRLWDSSPFQCIILTQFIFYSETGRVFSGRRKWWTEFDNWIIWKSRNIIKRSIFL